MNVGTSFKRLVIAGVQRDIKNKASEKKERRRQKSLHESLLFSFAFFRITLHLTVRLDKPITRIAHKRDVYNERSEQGFSY